jgi:RNA polymerase sigma factor (sigma-70 family)
MGEPGPEADWDSTVIRASLTDPPRFGEIFSRHAPALHRYLFRRAGPGHVDDLRSEIFIVAFRRRRAYDEAYHDARPWLFGIATNVVHHHHRSEGRRRALLLRARGVAGSDVAEDDTASEVVAQQEHQAESARVRQALARMPARHLDVLLLHTGPEFSYEEIARALDIPVGTVRSRLSRGRAQLRELLGFAGQYQEEGALSLHPPTSEEHRT